jgi:hypothetical protein
MSQTTFRRSLSKFRLAVIAIIIFLFLLSGCLKYSFKGALPSYLKTIAIPLFEDRSRWLGLQEELTLGVVDAFVQDNTYSIRNDFASPNSKDINHPGRSCRRRANGGIGSS